MPQAASVPGTDVREPSSFDSTTNADGDEVVPSQPCIPPELRPGYNLPISEKRGDIKRAVEGQRVVVVVGGTGCGKSTQVPQYILDEAAALGTKASIFVTQPRRMAAVTLARRVAEERGETVGQNIGYRIRGEVVQGEQLSFVTAGYLLAWLTAEPEAFGAATHIILDEAHERSAELELLLLLVKLLMRLYPRPRVILMSATIETTFFTGYFGEFATPRDYPPIQVGSRRFDVEEFHLDSLANGLAPAGRRLPVQVSRGAASCLMGFNSYLLQCESSVLRISREIEALFLDVVTVVAEAGTTILVFVPGYADLCRLHSKLYWKMHRSAPGATSRRVPLKPEELEDLDMVMEGEQDATTGPAFAVVPPSNEAALDADALEGRRMSFRIFALHSQVPDEDKEMVLRPPPSNTCHIVLATTIAESSLTLPEVSGVFDFALHRTVYTDPSQPGLTQLSTHWCARSSLMQRAGRTGRTRPGWCVRLVPSDFLDGLPEQDTPEVLRTPLTQLFLRTKGISDGLLKVVDGNAEATKNLALNAESPAALMAQLPAPPEKYAVEAAVQELAVLGVLTHKSEAADVTVLGRVTQGMPLDVRLIRLVWLGALWGCVPEAVVLAAACGSPIPFEAPTRFAFSDAEDFADRLRRSARSRRYFDGGHFSQPLMCLRLFCSFVRRMNIAAPRTTSHKKAWSFGIESLCESEAVDMQKMTRFINFVADIAMRARDMCDDSRDDPCPCRTDLHNLVRILRRPDLTPAEQRDRAEELIVTKLPRIGEIFRASASKLYALLAAAFSDQMLIGTHKYTDKRSALVTMLDALEELPGTSGVGLAGAVLVPTKKAQRAALADGKRARRMVRAMCGIEPSDVASTSEFMVCHFDGEGGKHESGPAQHAPGSLDVGLPPAKRPRLQDLALGPRLCFMASGGLRSFAVDGVDWIRAVSPYEMQFNLAHVSTGRRRLPGIFDDQNPLGSACHVVPAATPLGEHHVACTAVNLTLAASGSVRVGGETVLSPEQLLYALATFCLEEDTGLSFAFTRGPGGSEKGTRARMAAIRLHSFATALRFSHHVPGFEALDCVNNVRRSLNKALGSEKNYDEHGKKASLWQDDEARQHFDALVEFVDSAPPIGIEQYEDTHDFSKLVWHKHVPGVEVSQSRRARRDKKKLDVQALQPIFLPHSVERRVARRSAGVNVHSFECPDCGERFRDWEDCRQHYDDTGHMDVSTEAAADAAKAESRPVRFRCLQCDEPFFVWKDCAEHLKETGHLSWADASVAMSLCTPPSAPGDEDLAPPTPPEDLGEKRENNDGGGGRAANVKAAKPKAAKPKAAERKAAKPKTAKPKTVEPKAAETKAAETKEDDELRLAKSDLYSFLSKWHGAPNIKYTSSGAGPFKCCAVVQLPGNSVKEEFIGEPCAKVKDAERSAALVALRVFVQRTRIAEALANV